MINKTAASSRQRTAAGKAIGETIIPPATENTQVMTGRELLLDLAQSVDSLCEMVRSWRRDLDQLRQRIAELERRAA